MGKRCNVQDKKSLLKQMKGKFTCYIYSYSIDVSSVKWANLAEREAGIIDLNRVMFHLSLPLLWKMGKVDLEKQLLVSIISALRKEACEM